MNQKIYKLGKTKQENLKRFNQYPKGSILLLQHVCDNCDMLELKIIKYFKNKYNHRKDIGNEYFEGDYKKMIKDIHKKIEEEEDEEEDEDEDEDEEDEEEEDEDEDEDEEDEEEEDEEDNKDKIMIKNIKIKEVFNNKQPHIIQNYEDYKQICSTIMSIIITNKNKQIGYILLKNSKNWITINEYNHKIPIEEQETLLGWIKHHSINEFQKDNIMYYTKESFNHTYNFCMELGIRLDEDSTPFYYDYDKIIKDICKTCFNNKIELYVLQNYEYFISISNYDKKCILNTKTWQITDYYPETNKVLTSDKTSDVFYINKFKDFETDFVDNVIKKLLNNELYKQYKHLCYNIFVEHKKDIILTDYTYELNKYSSYMSDMITNLLTCLVPVKSYIYISTNKYGEKIPKKYNNIIRLIIIEYNNYIDKNIAKLQQLGYKNIIIIKKSNNLISYNDLILENIEKIKQLSKIHTNNDYKREINYFDVFYEKKLLLNNFLKWCCEC